MIDPTEAAARLADELRLTRSEARFLAELLTHGRRPTEPTEQSVRVIKLKLSRKLAGLAHISTERGRTAHYGIGEADRQALLGRAATLPPAVLSAHLRTLGLNHTLAVLHQTLAAADQWRTEAVLIDALSRAKGGRPFKASSLAMLMSMLRQRVAAAGLTIERYRYENRWRYHPDCLAAAQTLATHGPHLSPIKKGRASSLNDGPVWPRHEIRDAAHEIVTGEPAPRRPGAPSPYRGRR